MQIIVGEKLKALELEILMLMMRGNDPIEIKTGQFVQMINGENAPKSAVEEKLKFPIEIKAEQLVQVIVGENESI